jgi:hypothetical protein
MVSSPLVSNERVRALTAFWQKHSWSRGARKAHLTEVSVAVYIGLNCWQKLSPGMAMMARDLTVGGTDVGAVGARTSAGAGASSSSR